MLRRELYVHVKQERVSEHTLGWMGRGGFPWLALREGRDITQICILFSLSVFRDMSRCRELYHRFDKVFLHAIISSLLWSLDASLKPPQKSQCSLKFDASR